MFNLSYLTQTQLPLECARVAEISSGAPANLSSTQPELHDSTMKGLCEMNEHLLCKN